MNVPLSSNYKPRVNYHYRLYGVHWYDHYSNHILTV